MRNKTFLPAAPILGVVAFARSGAAVASLDEAGIHDEARRLLRGYWDKPVPARLAFLSQTEVGQWRDGSGDPRAHGFALQALAGHALATKDAAWTRDAWPALRRAVDWLARPEIRKGLSGEAKRVSARALATAAKAARLLDRAADAGRIEAVLSNSQ